MGTLTPWTLPLMSTTSRETAPSMPSTWETSSAPATSTQPSNPLRSLEAPRLREKPPSAWKRSTPSSKPPRRLPRLRGDPEAVRQERRRHNAGQRSVEASLQPGREADQGGGQDSDERTL